MALVATATGSGIALPPDLSHPVGMSEAFFFHALIVAWLALASVTFVALRHVAAPYGRHGRRGWGPMIDSRLGWVVMEAPAAVLFAVLFLLAYKSRRAVAAPTLTDWTFLAMWEAHYLHRAFIYPFRRGGACSRMPVSVPALAVFFNLVNAYLNGRYLFHFSAGYAPAWLADPRFLVGLAVFVAGYAINKRADAVLRRLRVSSAPGYKIPHGGLYRWVSCANYLGEIIEWLGWATATWSLAGLTFAVWTAANLAPRALAHHRWYREQFPDYPKGRRALIPGIW